LARWPLIKDRICAACRGLVEGSGSARKGPGFFCQVAVQAASEDELLRYRQAERNILLSESAVEKPVDENSLADFETRTDGKR
jgi:hypothetical protein